MNKTLQFFCPWWGSEHLPFEVFLSAVVKAGYDGVEMSLPENPARRTATAKAIRAHGLQWIGQHWETVEKDFDAHRIQYGARLQNQAAEGPLFINSQTGKDYFTMEQNLLLLHDAAEIAERTGIRIIHETHRGKFSFAAHTTAAYLKAEPSLRLCLDISHWCCVAETLLEDQHEHIELAILRTDHIHSRVGFAEGPQVMDPRAPEWSPVVEQHITWWQQVADSRRSRDQPTTITTEFGPWPYLQRLPYTKTPIYDQWEVNLYMMQLLRQRLAK